MGSPSVQLPVLCGVHPWCAGQYCAEVSRGLFCPCLCHAARPHCQAEASAHPRLLAGRATPGAVTASFSRGVARGGG